MQKGQKSICVVWLILGAQYQWNIHVDVNKQAHECYNNKLKWIVNRSVSVISLSLSVLIYISNYPVCVHVHCTEKKENILKAYKQRYKQQTSKYIYNFQCWKQKPNKKTFCSLSTLPLLSPFQYIHTSDSYRCHIYDYFRLSTNILLRFFIFWVVLILFWYFFTFLFCNILSTFGFHFVLSL